MYSADGVQELETLSRGWDDDGYILWLERGFARLDNPLWQAKDHLAFVPLRFHRDASILGQLMAFFSVAADHHPRLYEHARHAVEDHLRLSIGRLIQTEQVKFAAYLWRVYSAMGATGATIPLARRMIKELDDSCVSPDAIDELVGVITAAVAAAPLTTSQISFFEYLHERDFWRDEFVIFLVDRYLDWKGGPIEEAWIELLFHYGDALRAATNPGDPSGRAFLSRLAGRILPHATETTAPLTPAAAKALLEPLNLLPNQVIKEAVGAQEENEPEPIALDRYYYAKSQPLSHYPSLQALLASA